MPAEKGEEVLIWRQGFHLPSDPGMV